MNQNEILVTSTLSVEFEPVLQKGARERARRLKQRQRAALKAAAADEKRAKDRPEQKHE